MDILIHVGALFAAAFLGFVVAAILGANAYDKGYADGARDDYAHRHHAHPVITERDGRPSGKAW